jgi:hypothetical protein
MEFNYLTNKPEERQKEALKLHERCNKVMAEINCSVIYGELENESFGLIVALQKYLHGTGELYCIDYNE